MRRFIVVVLAVASGLGCAGKEKKEYTPSSMVETLKATDPNMRYWAARELGKAKGADVITAVAALREALTDTDEMVRMGAAYALADLGPEAKATLPELQKAGKDPSQQVREAAAYAVKKIKGGK